jgi:hypothetical protein
MEFFNEPMQVWLAVLLGGLLMSLSANMQSPESHLNQSSDSSSPPVLTYWHVWADEDGVSHQDQRQTDRFKQKSFASGADPQWVGKVQQSGGSVIFSVLPVGWVGDWHENPKPQWIIPLSGRWFVETMDGHRVEMGPGDISFGADQGTQADAEGHKGHLSGTVGDAPCVMMIVQFEQTPESV